MKKVNIKIGSERTVKIKIICDVEAITRQEK